MSTAHIVDFETRHLPSMRTAAPATLGRRIDGAIDKENDTVACVASETLTLLIETDIASPDDSAAKSALNAAPSSNNCCRLATGVDELKNSDHAARTCVSTDPVADATEE